MLQLELMLAIYAQEYNDVLLTTYLSALTKQLETANAVRPSTSFIQTGPQREPLLGDEKTRVSRLLTNAPCNAARSHSCSTSNFCSFRVKAAAGKAKAAVMAAAGWRRARAVADAVAERRHNFLPCFFHTRLASVCLVFCSCFPCCYYSLLALATRVHSLPLIPALPLSMSIASVLASSRLGSARSRPPFCNIQLNNLQASLVAGCLPHDQALRANGLARPCAPRLAPRDCC